jgi:hypothetical protein
MPRWLPASVSSAGDSASAFDPISGHGVVKAMRSGIFAAYAAADCLIRKDVAALDRYGAWVAREASAYEAALREHYGSESRWLERPFWRRRYANLFARFLALLSGKMMKAFLRIVSFTATLGLALPPIGASEPHAFEAPPMPPGQSGVVHLDAVAPAAGGCRPHGSDQICPQRRLVSATQPTFVPIQFIPERSVFNFSKKASEDSSRPRCWKMISPFSSMREMTGA